MVKDTKLSSGMGVLVKKQQIEEEMAKLHKVRTDHPTLVERSVC